MQELLISDQNGNKIQLSAQKDEDAIVFSRKNNMLFGEERRAVRLYCVDNERLEEFQSVEVSLEQEKNILGDFLFGLVSAVRSGLPRV